MELECVAQSNLAEEGGPTTVSRTWESDRTSFRDIWVSAAEKGAQDTVDD